MEILDSPKSCASCGHREYCELGGECSNNGYVYWQAAHKTLWGATIYAN